MDSARFRQLAADLRADREDLDRILVEAARCVEDLAGREPSSLEMRGAGDVAHDFYNAVEHYFERVAVELNGGLPAGRESHTLLLRQMSRGVEGIRPPVIDETLRKELHTYLRFRHLFRHGYGFSLEWARVEPLLSRMGDLAPDLRRQLDAFVATIEQLSLRLDPETPP